MSGTAPPAHRSNECNIPFKKEAEEPSVLTRHLPSQYLAHQHRRAAGAHARTFCKQRQQTQRLVESVTVAKVLDAATAQESNGRVLGLCDSQGSLWSKTPASLLMLILMLAGTAAGQGRRVCIQNAL